MSSLKRSPLPMLLATLAVALLVAVPVPGVLAASPTADAPGELMIFSTTTGADVEIDGKPAGKITADGFTAALPPGQHTIKVTQRGWTEFIDTFEIVSGQETELEIDLIPFAGIVVINTKVPGATVKIDGKVEGVTPFDKDVAVGKKVISVSRPGFQEDIRELEIKAGDATNIDIELREIPGGGRAGDPEFYETWWFWTIVGVAVAGGATAVALGTSSTEEKPPSANFTLQVP